MLIKSLVEPFLDVFFGFDFLAFFSPLLQLPQMNCVRAGRLSRLMATHSGWYHLRQTSQFTYKSEGFMGLKQVHTFSHVLVGGSMAFYGEAKSTRKMSYFPRV